MRLWGCGVVGLRAACGGLGCRVPGNLPTGCPRNHWLGAQNGPKMVLNWSPNPKMSQNGPKIADSNALLRQGCVALVLPAFSHGSVVESS